MTAPHPRWPVDQTRIDRNWRAITFELDAPQPGRVERFLRWLGLPTHWTRVVVATPSLRRSWYLATALAIIIGLATNDAARPRDDFFALLLVAPLVPVLGVALAYGTESDPAHEIGLATPTRGLRLVLTRTAVVLVFSIFWLGLASLLKPGNTATAFAWLIPGLGLTAAALALMTALAPRRAAAVSASAWVLGVTVVRIGAADPLAAFGSVGQLTMAAVAALGAAIVYLRREHFDRLEVVR